MIVRLDTPRVALLEGNTFELLPRFADKSAGLILTDPPYTAHTHANLGKENRGDGRKSRPPLTFPPLSNEQIAFLAREFVRISAGWIVVFTDDRGADPWGLSLERAGGRWVRTGHWVKTNPSPQMSGDRPSAGSEVIVIGHSFPPGVGRMAWAGGGRAAIWRGPRDMDDLHPNQKPLWLMQEILGLFAPAGSTVLDPFFGSGSTAVAGLATTRIPGLSPLEPACNACAKKLAGLAARPPLPSSSFIGIEGDAATASVAVDRLRGMLLAA